MLRERVIRTIVLCGVATHIGVESTVRSATSQGFEIFLAENATTSISADTRRCSTTHVFLDSWMAMLTLKLPRPALARGS